MRNLLITILLLLSAAAGAQTPVIEIEGGKVQGIDSHEPGVALFRGIPYAAPPVGELRYEDQVVVITDFKTGELTQRLYDTLTGIQWGKIPDDMGWTVKVI